MGYGGGEGLAEVVVEPAEERRVEGARGDRADADLDPAQVPRCADREPDYPRLGGGVGGLAHLARQAAAATWSNFSRSNRRQRKTAASVERTAAMNQPTSREPTAAGGAGIDTARTKESSRAGWAAVA
jgi:hypothetical protein